MKRIIISILLMCTLTACNVNKSEVKSSVKLPKYHEYAIIDLGNGAEIIELSHYTMGYATVTLYSQDGVVYRTGANNVIIVSEPL